MMQMKNVLIVQQVQSGIMNSVFILPNQVKSNYELINQRSDFRYLIIPSARFYGKIKVTTKKWWQIIVTDIAKLLKRRKR